MDDSWLLTNLNVIKYRQPRVNKSMFEKPCAIGCFSVTTERLYEPNANQLRYYRKPTNFPLDLNENIANAIKKPDTDDGIINLLKFIKDELNSILIPNPIEEDTRVLNVEFVCWRGLLSLVMCTPFENKQDWHLQITEYMGTSYIRKIETKQEKMERENMTQQQKNMCSWGFKFEQYCLAESPKLEPNTIIPVDESSEFATVFQTKISGISLLYGAEMDGIESDEVVPINTHNKKEVLKSVNFVELKVRKKDLNYYQQRTYDSIKSLKWWCQSFLVAVPRIHVGLRNDNGFVSKIETVEVRSLIRRDQNYWCPNSCIEFLFNFLKFVKTQMSNVNCPYTVLELYYNAKAKSISSRMLEGRSPSSFLPDWYIELIKQKRKSWKN